ncbi:unnamed protein product [Lymnaea stagnalis]|uniref:Uncharacterized protein n=1 Tax=Lymnaea stagnalis TaxID=6523 RepID=A0AAV2H810_LYMST
MISVPTGEGLIGSLTYKDLHDIALELGFSIPRMVRADAMPVLDEGIKHRLGNVQYASVTYRLFKKPTGSKLSVQSKIVYQGNIRGFEDSLRFDVGYTFTKGQMKTVDSHLVEILSSSRFSKYFQTYQPDQDTELPSLDVNPFEYIKKTAPDKSCAAVKTCCT